MYGTQLKYDGSFKNVVKKSPIFWKKNVDIPKNIRKFIDDFLIILFCMIETMILIIVLVV